MQETTEINPRVLTFICKRFPQVRKQNLGGADSLLGSGIIDSLGMLDLVAFLEQEFCMTVADEELSPDNFGTLNALTDFVKRKSSPQSASPTQRP